MDDLTTGQLAAKLFDDWALAELEAADERATKAQIARAVGEERQNYTMIANGKRAVTIKKVQSWMRKWEESGRARLRLIITSHSVHIEQIPG